MKHIFKKLHHHPNRSNETPPQTSTADHRSSTAAASSSSSSSPMTSSPAPSTTATTTTTTSTSVPLSPAAAAPPAINRQQDYYTSEEEYQMQLALALSVSASSAQESNLLDARSDHDRHHHHNQSLLGGRCGDFASHRDDAAADSLSKQYWDYNVLDYGEKVVEGFYDVYSLSTDPAVRGKMPSLTDIETNPSGSDIEVVIVNRKVDPALEELIQIAHCIALDCPATEINVLVQRISELVTDHMGGPVKDATAIQARWVERSKDLRTSSHTAILPLGSLRLGLSRHRALLFKVLADNVGIPCRLVKGSHYTGIEDDAVNIIKLPNESEFLVDLMGEPGTLIPADVMGAKDTSLKSYNLIPSKLPSLQVRSDIGPSTSLSDPSCTMQNNSSSGKESENTDLISSLPNRRLVSASTSGLPKRMPVPNQMDHIPSLALGASMYKGGRRPNRAVEGGRLNVNLVPKSQNNSLDPKDLFADLNPFQIKVSGNASAQEDHGRKKFDELQQPKGTHVTGQPPLPLGRKSSSIYDAGPTKSELNFVGSPFANIGDASGDPSRLLPSSTSFNPPAKATSDVYNIHSDPYNPFIYNENASVGDSLASIDWNIDQLTSEDVQCSDQEERYQRGEGVLQMSESNVTKAHGKNVSRLHDGKNNIQDGNVLIDQDTSSLPVKSGVPNCDPVIDDVSECEIPWEDFVVGERIGLGSYGEVYHADWNGTEVAVKKFLDQDFSGAALDEFRREVRIMQRLRHPNVVLFMGAVTRPPNLSIVTEFLPRGSLYRIIHRPQSHIDEKRRIKMALDVAKGMNCLHTSTPTIVHRDLKSPNLLVDKNWNVKVCDFGLSRLKHNTFLSSKSTAGTPEWMAPEVLRNEPSNEKCDVYSFGMILWELATLRLPWSGMNPMQVVGAVGFQNRRPEMPNEVDPLVARIIWECWQTDPNLRPSFAQLTVALKSLQRLVIPSHVDQPSSPMPQEISLNSTP